MNKSFRILLQALLFGILLTIPSGVYADAISMTTVSLTNIKVTTTAGNIQLGVWQKTESAMASNSQGQVDPMPPAVKATAMVNFANSRAVANIAAVTLDATSNVNVINCNCNASSAATASLINTFMVIGGNGNVVVNISALLAATQKVMTDQFGISAGSGVFLDFFVDDARLFTFDPQIININNPSSMKMSELSQRLTAAITVQFNTLHTINVSITANSDGVTGPGVNPVPEPTTAVLLFSGLGSLMALIKRGRHFRR